MLITLKKTEKYFKKLKEYLNELKRYQYNIIDNIDCNGIRQIEQLFNDINEEDYYKPIKTTGDFDENILIMKVEEIKIISYL